VVVANYLQGDSILAIEELNYQVYNCRKCRLWQGAKHGVPGEGPVNAKIMVVGQNPGMEEDETGRPFVGKAGKYLTKALSEKGLKREEIYITNIVKHISPKNRAPYADEITECLPYLIEQIDIVKPKKILLLGTTARQTPRIEGIEYFEVIHPSAALRFPKLRKKFEEQLHKAIDS
jgi:uracil-DNA glycosylase